MPPLNLELSRRGFLGLGAAALGGLLLGCGQPIQRSARPRPRGSLQRYSTTLLWDGQPHGVEIRLRSGQCVGISPLSGSPCASTPAAVLATYALAVNPPQLLHPMLHGKSTSWDIAVETGRQWFATADAHSLLVVPHALSLPLELSLRDWQQRTGAQVLRAWAPVRTPLYEELRNCRALLCLGADPLAGSGAVAVAQARTAGMVLLSAGSSPGLTGLQADYHLPWPDRLLPQLAERIAADLDGMESDSTQAWETLCAAAEVPLQSALELERRLQPGSFLLAGNPAPAQLQSQCQRIARSLQGRTLGADDRCWLPCIAPTTSSPAALLATVTSVCVFGCDPDRWFPGFTAALAPGATGLVLGDSSWPVAQRLPLLIPQSGPLRSAGAYPIAGIDSVSLAQALLPADGVADSASLVLCWLDGFPYSLSRHEAHIRARLQLHSDLQWQNALRRGWATLPPAVVQQRQQPMPTPPQLQAHSAWSVRPAILGGWECQAASLLADIPHPLQGSVWSAGVSAHPSVLGTSRTAPFGTQTPGTQSAGDSGWSWQLGPLQFPLHLDDRMAPGTLLLQAGEHSGESWYQLLEALRTEGKGQAIATNSTSNATANSIPADNLLLGHYPTHEWMNAGVPAKSSATRWGMVIDLDRCTGCSACVVACNVENLIPTAGANAWRKQRTTHWLRVERGNGWFLPIPCQQCGDAPCEKLCPTGATSHSADGINQMVESRCIGSRLCAVGCTYNVRRFHFDDSTVFVPAGDGQPQGPRGTMDKCSFCVHRLRDTAYGPEPRTACQDACPASAIHFGDFSAPTGAFAAALGHRDAFRLLADTGTDPSVVYLPARDRGVRQ